MSDLAPGWLLRVQGWPESYATSLLGQLVPNPHEPLRTPFASTLSVPHISPSDHDRFCETHSQSTDYKITKKEGKSLTDNLLKLFRWEAQSCSSFQIKLEASAEVTREAKDADKIWEELYGSCRTEIDNWLATRPNREAYMVVGTKTFEKVTVQWQAGAHKGKEARADVPLGDAANIAAAATAIPPMVPRGVDIEFQTARATSISREGTRRDEEIKLYMIRFRVIKGRRYGKPARILSSDRPTSYSSSVPFGSLSSEEEEEDDDDDNGELSASKSINATEGDGDAQITGYLGESSRDRDFYMILSETGMGS